MNMLHNAVDNYLKVRRFLGFKLEREGRLLLDFADFIEQQGDSLITTERALQWAMAPAGASQRSGAKRLTMVRGLAKYVHAQDPCTQIPSRDLLPLPARRRLTPYVYSDGEVQALMEATRIFCGLKSATYKTLIGLLAVTGMRVGEAIGLDRSDLDWRDGLLLVRNAKFGRLRELPLHPTTVEALRTYARQRDRTLSHPSSPSFLLSLQGTRLHYKNVHHGFLRLLRLAGMANRRPRRPRIHDLRHTFATKTLLSWQRDGLDIQQRLPWLSTYMGHIHPSDTYWYLTATPELLQHAAQPFQHTMGDLP
jgi:integrase/recombinase XerD